MKLTPNIAGFYYAHLTGSPPIKLGTKNRDEAKRLAKAARLEEIEFAAKAKLLTAEAVQRLTSDSRITGEQALEKWRDLAGTKLGLSPTTLYGYESNIRRFLVLTKLADRPITTASFSDVDDYVNAHDGTTASTRNSRRSSLENFFKVCADEGFIVRNPAGLTKVRMHRLTFEQKEKQTREPFTELELDVLSTVEDPFWKVAIHLSLNYGLRLADISQLEWASFAKKGRLVVWTDKRDRRIEMPLLDETEALMRTITRGSSQWVFPIQSALTSDPNKRATHSTYFGRILRRLGIEGKSFHCLRHTFASRRAAHGDTIDEIRIKMGHTSKATTEGYVHPN